MRFFTLTTIRLAVTLALTAIGFTVSSLPATAQTAVPSAGAPYWIANPSGAVWNFGSAAHHGDLSAIALNKPIVGMTPTTNNLGYWLVATDGGIFSFGNASFYGSTGHIKLNKPIVAMAPTPANKGYWMVATDGGIFSFGDAQFFGSTGSLPLNKPIVAMAPTPTGNGYWLVASDGGIFTFGDARFYGSTGAIKLHRPIVAMAPTPTGNGYWLVASDGGIFNFGDAGFHGSTGGGSDNNYAKITRTSDGKGYWLLRSGGDAVPFGSADTGTASGYSATATSRPAFALIHNITGPGDLALEFAMRQRGKPYVWGGTGPDGYDCSGLMQAAWKQGGISLPRIAADQYNAGTKVPLSQLKVGDIVFWANDINDPTSIYHDAMYIGNNNVVMAPKTGDVVRVAAIWQAGLLPYGVRPR